MNTQKGDIKMLRKAVRWTGVEKAEYYEEEPRPVGENEVLINTKYSLVSTSTEAHWFTSAANHKVLGTTFPFIPGYSAAGTVLEVGKAVTGFKAGDKVVGAPLYGAHSNLTYVDAQSVYPVADSVSLDDAVFFNLGMTSLYSLYNAHLQLGESIALVGQGVVGQICLQGAVASGLHPIVTADLNPQARQRSLELGADDTFDPIDPADVKRIKDKYHGFKATIDMSGSNAGMNLAIELAAKFGRVVLCTGGIAGKQALDYEAIALKCLTLRGDFVNADMPLQRKCINDFLWLLGEKKISAPRHADSIYLPTDATIKEVYRKIVDHDRSVGHPIFKW